MSRLRFIPIWTGWLAVLLGAITVAGWYSGVGFPNRLFPGLTSMKALTAFCFVLAGGSLVLQTGAESVPSRRMLFARILAGAVLIIALLSLAEYIFDLKLGIDQLLVWCQREAGRSIPGRMAAVTGVDFTLLGMALLLLGDGRGKRRTIAQYLTLIALGIALFAFVGIFYGAESQSAIARYFAIAVHTAIAFWLLCLGILFAHPEHGLTAVFLSQSPGGIVARRLLPLVMVLPVLGGWLGVTSLRSGLLPPALGTAAFTILRIICLGGLVVWTAVALNRAEAERRKGADALEQSRIRLDGIISSAMDAVISVNEQQRIVLFNPAAERMFEVPASRALGQPIESFLPHRFRPVQPCDLIENGRTGFGSSSLREAGRLTALRANGQEFPVEASISQVQLRDEKLFTVFLRDISERRQAETNLLESQRREHSRRTELETLMESAPAIIWIADDAECRHMTGNKAAQELLRMAPEANMSLTAPAGDQPSHFQVFKDGRLLPNNDLPMQTAGRERKAVLGQVLEFRFSDGRLLWVYGNAAPLLAADGTVRGVVGAFVDITSFKETELELSRSRENLRGLAGRLQAVREEERTRVAREIHDVLAQQLTRLKMDILWLKRRLSGPLEAANVGAVRERLSGMVDLSDQSIASVQRIATELRPLVLDSLGLCAAVEWQAKDFQAHSGITCNSKVPEEDLRPDSDASTALFRILQETLTNVARHAKATRVEVELRREPGWLVLTARDNGTGIPIGRLTDPQSLGLIGMRERATLLGGNCSITPWHGGGTMVEATLPFHEQNQAVEI